MSESTSSNKYPGIFALACVFILAFSLSCFKVRSFDLPWHVRTGEWIVENRAVPRTDFYCFVREGEEWIDAQWLYQVVAFETYHQLGEDGLTILNITLVIGSLVLLLAMAPAGGLRPEMRALAGAIFLIGLNARIISRPELLSCLYFAALFFLLERARNGRTWLLVLLPLVQLLWANSEGVWPIGLCLIGTYIADQAYEARKSAAFTWRRPVPWPWAAALGASVLACLVQPYGWKGFTFPFMLLEEVATGRTMQKQTIVEIQAMWQNPPIQRAEELFFVLAAAAAAAVVMSGKKLRPALALFGVLFIYLAVNARRNISFSSVALMGVLMAHLEILARTRPRLAAGRMAGLAVAGIAVIICLSISALTLGQPYREWDQTRREPGFGLSRRYYPVPAAAFLKSIGYEGNIINNTRQGGFLIWYGWPRWKVFSESRMEIKGEESLALWNRVYRNQAEFRAVAELYHVEAVFVDQWDQYLQRFAAQVLADKDWALVFVDRDHNTLIFLKRVPRWHGVIALHEIKP
ncbi:MAG TPA: hypothetical protein VM658_16280 [bacterium]|nr:hypothetical protein [bacterium]